jgi:hypothetical protein
MYITELAFNKIFILLLLLLLLLLVMQNLRQNKEAQSFDRYLSVVGCSLVTDLLTAL